MSKKFVIVKLIFLVILAVFTTLWGRIEDEKSANEVIDFVNINAYKQALYGAVDTIFHKGRVSWVVIETGERFVFQDTKEFQKVSDLYKIKKGDTLVKESNSALLIFILQEKGDTMRVPTHLRRNSRDIVPRNSRDKSE